MRRPEDFHPPGTGKYTVPVPPSTNHLFATVGNRRIKSRGYLGWLTEAGWEVKAQHPYLIKGGVEVEYICPLNKRRDLGNYEKPLSDLLVKMQVIEDDKLINKLSLRWDPLIERVLITVKPCLI